MPTPDVFITPIQPPGPAVGFGLAGSAEATQYMAGGYAWTPIVRPKRKPYTEFTSDQLLQLQMPLLVDASDTNTSIEHSVAQVDNWRHPSAASGEPPILAVAGPVPTFGVAGFVVQQMDWGTNPIRRRDGALTQQDLTLTLLEYTGTAATPPIPTLAAQVAAILGVLRANGVQVPAQLSSLIAQLPSLLSSASPAVTSQVTTELAQFIAAIPNNTAGSSTVVSAALPQLAQILPTLVGGRTYVVRDGDTLPRIAARELGDYRKWTVLSVLNGIRDPASVTINQRILLP